MNDLDTLRPEVREALDEVTRCTECMHIADYSDAPDIIRAELLRLTDDCARLVDCINAQPPTRRSLIDRAERAEAELRRLAGERDELRTAYTSASQSRDYWKECAGRASSELAALKARIAEAARAYHSSFEYTLDASTLYARATGIPGEETYALVKVED